MLLVPSKLKSSQFYTYIYQAMQCDDFICLGIPFKCITNTACVRARLCKLQKGYTRLAAASDKVYQLLANGRWFSPDTPASSTTTEDAGVTILSEAGVCPGLDHMLAMKCFDEVKSSGGKVGQLYSIQ
jgi:hypothetical protein